MTLGEPKDECLKFLPDAILVLLKQPLLIQSFMLNLGGRRSSSRSPRTAKIYVSSAEPKNANELLKLAQ
jgi:hypothetical protein